jgi:hypothetical protein
MVTTEFVVFDKVKVVKTTDPLLDDQTAKIVGFHMHGAIILFDGKPVNYNPAMVISTHCLERIQ